ncbi:LysR family transcriptional regulator [Chishuiella changwenlii]|uniref:LysR family transcriptional regulator n=2 Tax=Chishuiella changwenlii TaxID=1434701 RepID=A0ABQ1TU98_9FLAO|nr:LysR family transcriptional regulator [Chishuiella changwenlii]
MYMVNFEWYRTFVAIYQKGNLTKAAQELLISQPNVSVHLAALEQYVGDKLFDRMPRKMVPTESGRQLYTQVIGSVENLTSIEALFTKKALVKRSVIKLGAPIEFFYSEITPNLNKTTSQIHATFGLAKELTQQLIDGDLDFIIASQKTADHKQIVYEEILKENFIIIADKTLDIKVFNDYIEQENFIEAEQWLLQQDWFAYSADLAYIRRFWLKNFNKRPVLIPKYIVPNLITIIKSMSEGSGISVVSDFLAKDYIKEKKVISIWNGKAKAENTIYLAYDKSKISNQKIEEMKMLLDSN